MKILIDERVDQRLRFLFSGHDCETAAYAKLSGLKNGALLAAGEAADFEVMVTTDQEIPLQQNLANRKISVIVLCARTKQAGRPPVLGSSSDRSAGFDQARSGNPDCPALTRAGALKPL